MNDLVSNKKTAFLLIVTLVVLVLGVIYFYFIYPLNKEKKSKEEAVRYVQSEIGILQSQLATSTVEESKENMFALQKKIPNSRALDQLIRSIEEVELISESKIESINFNNYDEIVAESDLAATESKENEQVDNTETTENNISMETPVSPVANIELPAQLKLITFNISVVTKDYDHLMIFIEELEKLERIVRMDQIEFSMPGEEQLYEMNSEGTISAQIQLTTFYYDGE